MDIRVEIKRLTEKAELSVRQLSLKSGVRRQSIMHFLAGGNIHLNNLEKILSALGHEIEFSETRHPHGTSKDLTQRRLRINRAALKKFCRANGIKYLAVFGSVLRDDFVEDSDIDVVIKLKQPVSFFDFMDIEEGLKRLFKTRHKLDVVTVNSVSPIIADEINNDSEILYEEAA